MPSLVPNFEYDIFISYRHNDNLDGTSAGSGQGWVTDFVQSLEKELRSTIKEPLSIYFDKNPHDGLLETHDVDDSLKEKLKCIIFIPIISRTYCDPKSFAWNHEFLPFLRMAAADSVGLKVRLPNGNTASRVMPVRIHELDANDKRMIEAELQGVLRAIDFTYKAAGINRPLHPKDDEAIKASGQPTYRDQINKTANAISDLIAGMQGRAAGTAETSAADDQQFEAQPVVRRNWRSKIPTFSRLQLAVAGFVVSMLLLAFLSVVHFSETNPSPVYRAIIPPPDNTKFRNYRGGNFALSPDGTMMAFVAIDSLGKSLLYVRSLNALEARALNGTEGALRPFWSPDSRFIGFFAERRLKKIDVAGGPALELCEGNENRGGSWNQDGVIIFSVNESILRVSSNGGASVRVTHLDTVRGETSHRWPIFLPDGHHFFFTARGANANEDQDDAIYMGSLDSTFKPRMIAKASSSLAFANGYLIYYKGGALVAQPFDVDNLRIAGDPIPIANQVYYESVNSNAAFSVSQNGLLAYYNDLNKDERTDFMWYNRNGSLIGKFSWASGLRSFRISPDGAKVAVEEYNLKKEGRDIWLYETDRDAWIRFTFGGRNFSPVWSPDGKMMAYSSSKDRSSRLEIYLRDVSGAGKEERIIEGTANFPTDWSRDSMFIAYASFGRENDTDIWILPMSTSGNKSGRQPIPFLQTEFNEGAAVFSPDGRWIAYHSNESGKSQVYVRPFPGPGGKWQVSRNGGVYPHWRGDGKELFFVANESFHMMSADISTRDATVAVGVERKLFQFGSDKINSYGVTSNGQKFLMATPRDVDKSIPVTLVVNWLEELRGNK